MRRPSLRDGGMAISGSYTKDVLPVSLCWGCGRGLACASVQGGIAAKSLRWLACGTYYDKGAHISIYSSVATTPQNFIQCKYFILQGWHSVVYMYISLVFMVSKGPFLLDGVHSIGCIF